MAEGPLLGDGGYLLELEKRGYPPDLWIGEDVLVPGRGAAVRRARGHHGAPGDGHDVVRDPARRGVRGQAPGECARRLADAGAHIVGVNCLNGPAQQLPIAEEIVRAVDGTAYVASQPVAYATTDDRPDFTASPEFPYGLTGITLPRGQLAAFATRARDAGVRYIGSCCGSVAEHVRAMAKALDKLPIVEREWRSRSGKAMSAFEYHDHTETEVPTGSRGDR